MDVCARHICYVPDSLEDVQVEVENELTKQQAMDVDRADNTEVFE